MVLTAAAGFIISLMNYDDKTQSFFKEVFVIESGALILVGIFYLILIILNL